ncbi:MAG: ATP-dependent endonuclease [Candidatus Bathyarchaeota archaeon]|nr:ATP-dependent endonuclease [Candidatus Bathyarchaeota archaeon]
MKIKNISVKNYRCLKDVTIPFDDLTVLVGRNGVGKSCLLNILGLFYKTSISIRKEDYYCNNTNEPISIIVEFSNLSTQEKKLFEHYVNGDQLVVEKTIAYSEFKPIQKYYGTSYENPDFEAFRKSSGQEMRKEYKKIREKEEYTTFPEYSNEGSAIAVLQEWESANKVKCKPVRADDQFFGFQNVGKHRLEKYTKFIFIPAVQEVSDEASEQKGTVFEELMGLVVKSTLATHTEIIKLQSETQKRFKELINPENNKELKGLEGSLTKNLNNFVVDSEVRIQWIDDETGVHINLPRAFITLKEGGYQNTVDRCGNGLQRAFVLSMFQELAIIQAKIASKSESAEADSTTSPSLIIGIEEPELYQHPDRTRHFAQTLLQLSQKGIEGAIANIQITYSTHSPLLIDFQRVNQLRIFKRKKGEGNKPAETQISFADLSEIARAVETAKNERTGSITQAALMQRLISLMSPWVNEGFFAVLVVLVEGIKDRALIVGEALTRNINLESKGICVIPCSGKDSMTEAISIFKSLKIPLYAVWDSDLNKTEGINANHNILRSFGCQPEDYPSKITDDFSCIQTNLEKQFRDDINEPNFNRGIAKYCQERQLGKPNYVMENPYAVCEIIKDFRAQTLTCQKLCTIVDKILQKYTGLQEQQV